MIRSLQFRSLVRTSQSSAALSALPSAVTNSDPLAAAVPTWGCLPFFCPIPRFKEDNLISLRSILICFRSNGAGVPRVSQKFWASFLTLTCAKPCGKGGFVRSVTRCENRRLRSGMKSKVHLPRRSKCPWTGPLLSHFDLHWGSSKALLNGGRLRRGNFTPKPMKTKIGRRSFSQGDLQRTICASASSACSARTMCFYSHFALRDTGCPAPAFLR